MNSIQAYEEKVKCRLLRILCLLVLCETASFAGTGGKISGRITDKATNEGVIGVNVVINGTTQGATTDARGDYFILGVPPGMYSVTASCIGYRRVTQTEVRVRIDQTTILNFALSEELIQSEGVTIVAERPKVELDLTSSKESISRDEIANSWGTSVKEAIADLASTNINGGIRGSFGTDVSYRMDGMDLRDPASNSNFGSVNLSTVQEIEVLTGGWNAEYGQANGSIINIITRKAEDRIRGVISYRMRPPGVYHWGRDFFGNQDFFSTVMETPEFWNPDGKWKSPWMADSLPGYSGGIPYYRAMSDTGRALAWKQYVDANPMKDYSKHMQWEEEITLYGPITDQIGFMISGRYKEGVTIYPSSLAFNPDMTFQGSLDWRIRTGTKLSLNAIFSKFKNSGTPRTSYQSSEEVGPDIEDQGFPYLTDPYSESRFWVYGTKGNSDEYTVRPPEKAQMLNLQAKLTHMFSDKTFMKVAFQHSHMEYRLDYLDVMRSGNFPNMNLPSTALPDTLSIPGSTLPGYGRDFPISFQSGYIRWGMPGDIWRNWSDSRTYVLKGDLTSQITKNHLVKSGFIFSLQEYQKTVHEGTMLGGTAARYAQVNDIIPETNHPYEGAIYAQDKIELGGMIVNAGLRLDFFNINKAVSTDIFDPLMISAETPGNPGKIGKVGYRPDGSGPDYYAPATQYALSPRLGISHPITETTVLHFMFGKFYQRPSWNKLLNMPEVIAQGDGFTYDMTTDWQLPDTTTVIYRFYGPKVGNPALTWEKMTQYEIGFEQNIADMLLFDFTLYVKDAYDLTSLGIDQGPASSSFQESGGSVDTRLYGDPYNPDGQVPGRNIRWLYTTVNGAWARVRGIEMKLGSRLRWINIDLSYNLSYLATGEYHYDRMYKSFPDGKRAEDRYTNGVWTPSNSKNNNTDNGNVGTDDAGWNPHNSAIMRLNITSPEDFGPVIFGCHPFGDWSISTSTRWVEGETYTWYPSDYTGERTPDNRRWEDRWNTNLNINKAFWRNSGLKVKLFVQVTNLFNNRHLRLLSDEPDRLLNGTQLTTYLTNGMLPFNSFTKEPAEWYWYTNLPMQMNIGMSIEF